MTSSFGWSRSAVEVLVFHRGRFSGSLMFTTSEITIGRDPQAMVRLEDPSISRNHAVIRFDGRTCEFEDLGSRAGVLVNGVRAPAGKVEATDDIGIGPFRLRLSLHRAGDEAAEGQDGVPNLVTDEPAEETLVGGRSTAPPPPGRPGGQALPPPVMPPVRAAPPPVMPPVRAAPPPVVPPARAAPPPVLPPPVVPPAVLPPPVVPPPIRAVPPAVLPPPVVPAARAVFEVTIEPPAPASAMAQPIDPDVPGLASPDGTEEEETGVVVVPPNLQEKAGQQQAEEAGTGDHVREVIRDVHDVHDVDATMRTTSTMRTTKTMKPASCPISTCSRRS